MKEDAPPAPPAEGDAKPAEGDEGNSTTPAVLQDELLPSNEFNITQCNQVITATGHFIVDLWNLTQRGEMTLVMNVYTVSIFTKATPDSLLDSIDMAFVSDVREIEGAPECLVIQSKPENKTLIPCFGAEDNKPAFIKAYEILKKCSIQEEEAEEQTECEKELASKNAAQGGAASAPAKEGAEVSPPAAPKTRRRRFRLY